MIHLLLSIIYLAFISLGLPDGLLGAAWPSIYPQFQVPVSYAGAVSAIICIGTVISSLMSDRLTRRFGPGAVTAASVAMTAAALLGFSCSHSFLMLCLWAIPYGLGAGSVDAALNNYVALHWSSRHMSWLHCMWGIGASAGPYVMGRVLTGGGPWAAGYRMIGTAQLVLTAILIMSLPLWKKQRTDPDPDDAVPLPLPQVLKLPGTKELMIAFFCYCALEQTAALWAGSYLVLHTGLAEEDAASLASLFFLGMTVGRAISGFLTAKLDDTSLIRLGMGIILLGIGAILLGKASTLAGFLLTGLGCAPIYPCIIHSTPEHFGAQRSQALIGIEMASAYIGTALMPPLFGILAQRFSISLLGLYLLLLLTVMALTHERMLKKCRK